MRACLAWIAGALLVLPTWAESRDPRQRAEFVKAHPCPATGKARGACPGWVVDHIEPLCIGGPDRPVNMQWQRVAESIEKDNQERRACRMKSRR